MWLKLRRLHHSGIRVGPGRRRASAQNAAKTRGLEAKERVVGGIQGTIRSCFSLGSCLCPLIASLCRISFKHGLFPCKPLTMEGYDCLDFCNQRIGTHRRSRAGFAAVVGEALA